MTGAALTPTGVLVGATSGNARVSIDAGNATDAISLPSGTTGQRPPGIPGEIRYNSQASQFEGFITAWTPFSVGGISVQNNSVSVNTVAAINFVNTASVLVVANDDYTHARVNLSFLAFVSLNVQANSNATTQIASIANINFNNTSTVNVSVTSAAGSTANVALQGNVAAITALTEANVTLAYNQANAAYSAANAAGNSVAVYEAGTIVLSAANLNFNNTQSINLLATANGTTQVNVQANINLTLNLTSLNVTSNIANVGNVLVSQNLIAGNIQSFGNILTGNLLVSALANTTSLNVSGETELGYIIVRQGFPNATVISTPGSIGIGASASEANQESITMFANNAGTDAGFWEIAAVNTGTLKFWAANDNTSNIHNWLVVNRSGTTINAITLGSAGDLPPITLDGPTTIPSTLNVTGASITSMGYSVTRGSLPGTGTINTIPGGVFLGDQAFGNTQCIEIFCANAAVDNGWWEIVAQNSGVLAFRTANDTYGNNVSWLRVVRANANANIGTITLGVAADNPITTILGNLVVQRASGACTQGEMQITDGHYKVFFNSNTTAGTLTPLTTLSDAIVISQNTVGGINTGALTLSTWASNAAGIRITNNEIFMVADGGQGTLNVNVATVNINAALTVAGLMNIANLNVSSNFESSGVTGFHGGLPANVAAVPGVYIGTETLGNGWFLEMNTANSVANTGLWEFTAANNNTWTARLASDDYTGFSKWLTINRTVSGLGGNVNIASITIGNPQDANSPTRMFTNYWGTIFFKGDTANTCTTPVWIQSAGGTGGLGITRPVNTAAGIIIQTVGTSNTQNRWFIASNQTVEAGGNTGADFGIFAYGDGGQFIGTAMTIIRANLDATHASNVTVPFNLIAGNVIASNIQGLNSNAALVSVMSTTYAGVW